MKIPYRWRYAPIRNLLHIYWDVVEGVRNLIKWFPVIWADRDFDHTYMWRMFAKKLEHMGNEHVNCGFYLGHKTTGRRILTAAKLCKKMADEDYPFDFKKHDKAHAKDLKKFSELLKESRRWWW